MEKWTKNEEFTAQKEYLSMIDTLRATDEFSDEWCGKWEDFDKEIFGGKIRKVKGDKHKFMKYWLENQNIINDNNWNKITEEDEYF